MGVWDNYFNKTKDKPARPLLVEALAFVSEGKAALDVGSGALNDARYLVEQGFTVTALDKKAVAEYFGVPLPKENFKYIIEPFETFSFPEATFDLVNAQFSLPFIAPQEFPRVFHAITNSLKGGGIFVGQLFGIRDSWSNNPNMTFHSKGEAHELFQDFELLKFVEEEKDGSTAIDEEKHWHIFHYIAQKQV